nr:ribosome small subunit-dependent GTPase A [Veronia pacifica]
MKTTFNQFGSISLQTLGWRNTFQQQLSLELAAPLEPARVIAQHRSEYLLVSESGPLKLPVKTSMEPMTVGDWVVVDSHQNYQLLQRQSLFARKAVANNGTEKLIAANVDTAFIVCSLNNDFNLNRIERYLSLCHQAQVNPVIVLSKADLCLDIEVYLESVQSLDPLLSVQVINGLCPESVNALHPWCESGQTVVMLGSSGVGKSTLINTLCGQVIQDTGGIREDDSKGRHTTSSRSVHLMPQGGLLIDVPGMREIQLSDCREGIYEAFADIERLVANCRYSDCQHKTEPGCQVIAHLESGNLDIRR